MTSFPDARTLLGPDGPIGGALRAQGQAYESRPQQLDMTDSVARAFGERSRLLVEAGTGVGKSFAYLVPAILRCLLNNERVVVATNTIALQEQLVGRDIPLLVETLGERGVGWGMPDHAPELRPVLVKGRNNYMSIRRLKLASERASRLFSDGGSRRTLAQIQDWAYETTDGTRSTLPMLERPGVWDRVESDSGNCMGRRCPHHEACFYQAARREMEKGNLLICNHALFFSDLALRTRDAGFLPPYQHVVLDEAHNVEDVASDHFGLSLTEGRVRHLVTTLVQRRSGKGYLAHLAKHHKEPDLVESAKAAAMETDGACVHLFDQLLDLSRTGGLVAGRLPEPGLIDNHLTHAARTLALRLRDLRDGVGEIADRYELNSYAERAQAIGEAAEALVDQLVPGCVYWVEVSGAHAGASAPGGRVRIRLACSPIEVGPLLREHLFESEASVVLTSATLATRSVGEDEPVERAESAFAHAIERLGADGSATLQLGSPFEYESQVRLIVDTSVPDPRSGGGSEYLDVLAERVADHALTTGGGAFVLFTAFSTLHGVAERIRGRLEDAGSPVLVQGRDAPRSELLRQFKESPGAVLFGAASFWQGVDVPGDALRNVIITRLPFEPPDRPLTQARLERIRERGGNPFMEDSLPRAIIRFKQGFGRLIRSHSDAGRVVILDRRVATARYGRLFLEALPPGLTERVETPGGFE